MKEIEREKRKIAKKMELWSAPGLVMYSVIACVCEIEALHCLAMMQHISHSVGFRTDAGLHLHLRLLFSLPLSAAAVPLFSSRCCCCCFWPHLQPQLTRWLVMLLCDPCTFSIMHHVLVVPSCAATYLVTPLAPSDFHPPLQLLVPFLGLLPIAFIACFMEIFRH